MRQIHCGNCKGYHDSSAEARDCYNSRHSAHSPSGESVREGSPGRLHPQLRDERHPCGHLLHSTLIDRGGCKWCNGYQAEGKWAPGEHAPPLYRAADQHTGPVGDELKAAAKKGLSDLAAKIARKVP